MSIEYQLVYAVILSEIHPLIQIALCLGFLIGFHMYIVGEPVYLALLPMS